MAWLYKRGGVWWMGWRHEGKQHLRSTGHTEKTKAEKEAATVDALFAVKRAGSLTDEIVAQLTGKAVKRVALADYVEGWLKECHSATERTQTKYKQIVREFLAFTEAREKGLLLDDVTVDHLKGFFTWKRERSSSSTVAGFRRVLRSIFLQAQEEGKIRGNPVQSANRLKNRVGERTGEALRKRPFTIAEIKSLHEKADPFWRFMVRVAYFTGMRMGDIVTLQHTNVDLKNNVIAFVSRKTGKPQKVPMHPELRPTFLQFPKGEPNDYFWPEEAERYQTTGASSLSQEFYDLMASCGIVKPRDPKKKTSSGKGRAAKREQTLIGFHNFRHTFVSMLKLSGAMDSVAKELVGHRSDAINTHYTHLPDDALRFAINKLPGVAK